MVQIWTIWVVFLLIASQRSFVDTAPLPEDESKSRNEGEDVSVQELESLKKSFGRLGKTLDMIKSHASVYTNINGHKQSRSETREEVKSDGVLMKEVNQEIDRTYENNKQNTQMKTSIDIPSQGVHKTIIHQVPDEVTKNVIRRVPVNPSTLPDDVTNTIERVDSGFGIQYSPLDIAEYIFWTGDEKGVALATEEFLKAGLMSPEEALSFLQEIKYNLENLKSHYTQLGSNSLQRSKLPESAPKQTVDPNPIQILQHKPELRSSFNIKQLRQEVDKKRVIETSRATLGKVSANDKILDDDYEDLLERLRLADFLYTEYSLEEVIYQLAKVMFTQSLTRGSAEAQQALQKFTNFLEVEAAQGHISRTLEKKVLDVLIASLSDTLTEHPELMSVAEQSMGPMASNSESQNFIRKILDSNMDDTTSTRHLYAHKEPREDKKNMQNSEQKNVFPNSYIEFAEYKNL